MGPPVPRGLPASAELIHVPISPRGGAPLHAPQLALQTPQETTDLARLGDLWQAADDLDYRAAFTFDASGLHEADPTSLTVPNTPIHLDLTEAFAAID